MATTELQGIVRFRFHDGDVEEFKRLSAQCTELRARFAPGGPVQRFTPWARM